MNKKNAFFALAVYFCASMQLNAGSAEHPDAAYHAYLNPYSSNVLKDLEVFQGQGRDGSGTLFEAIDRTSTPAGQQALRRRLEFPKTTAPELRKAQILPKVLLGNVQALTFLDTALQGMKGDTAILEALQEKDVYTQKAFDGQYMANNFPLRLPAGVSKAWKESPRLMQAEVYYKKYYPYISTVLTLLQLTNSIVGNVRSCVDNDVVMRAEARKRWKAEWEERKATYQESDSFWDSISRDTLLKEIFEDNDQESENALATIESVRPIAKALVRSYYSNLIGTDKESEYRERAWKDSSSALSNGLALVNMPLGVHALYNAQRAKKTVDQDLASRVAGVAKLINASYKIYEYGKQNKTFAAAFPGYVELDIFFSRKPPLVKILQGTLTSDGSQKSLSKGTVLACNALIEDSSKKIKRVLRAVGDLDASLSIAKLVKESQQNPVQYSMVEYLEDDKPRVQLNDFWNPVVDPHVVVPNSIELGSKQGPSTIVVTGPNTGGKSTIVKGLVANLWLSHTLGIAPSSKACMTPFATLDSSMNIVDNTANGISLFAAEIERAALLRSKLESLESKKGKFGFFAFDEMFKGTDPAQAQLATTDCIKELASCRNSLAVVATHFKEDIDSLEEKTQGACKNFKVDIKQTGEKLERTFKLEPGVSRTNVARYLLNEALARNRDANGKLAQNLRK